MTVSSTSNRKTFTGDGVTAAFGTSPVVFFDEGDLTIYTVVTATGVATQKTITTHYTVSGGAGSTGTVTMLTAPAVGETLVIVRELDLVQEVDFVNNEATDAEVAEDALDKLTMMAQQLSARLDRSFVLPDSDVSGASTEVPTPSASKLIGWDSAGTALTNYAAASIADTIVPTAFMETLLDDANAAAARATLDAQQDVFTTRGDLVRAGASGVAERVALGANNKILKSDGTDVVWGDDVAASETVAGNVEIATQAEVNAMTDTGRALTPNHNKIVLGTEQATTSGTAIDFTGIPAGVRRITIEFVGVSTNGTSPFIVQLGDAGGIENTGYIGAASTVTSAAAAASASSTAGFSLNHFMRAAGVYSGVLELSLENAAAFTWVSSGNLGDSATPEMHTSAGSKSLSAELTQLRITTAGGTAAFDAGAINISYER